MSSTSFPQLSPSERLTRLEPPAKDKRLPMVLDTDPYNEIDDQFAITYAMFSPDRLQLKAIYAAPFANRRSDHDEKRGMELSYQTAFEVLEKLNLPASELPSVHRGAPRFSMNWEKDPTGFTGEPVLSDATAHLIELARSQPDEEPLYVVAIAAITNVASAILEAPDIIRKIVVVWLAGHPHTHYDTNEFNLQQDTFSARVILDSGVPLIRIPCANVAEHLRVSADEARVRMDGKGVIGTYLTAEYMKYVGDNKGASSRPIWDMVPIAWLIEPERVQTVVIPTPVLGTSPLQLEPYYAPHLDEHPNPRKDRPAHCTWSFDPRRHATREAFAINRDAIFEDFYNKLEAYAANG